MPDHSFTNVPPAADAHPTPRRKLSGAVIAGAMALWFIAGVALGVRQHEWIEGYFGSDSGGGHACDHPAPAGDGMVTVQALPSVEVRSPDSELSKLSPLGDRVIADYLDLQQRLALTSGAVDVSSIARDSRQWAANEQVQELKSAATAIADGAEGMKQKSPTEQRRLFRQVSEELIRVLECSRPSEAIAEKLHVVNCSMAKGRWVQKETDVRNPYDPEHMRSCGTVESIVRLGVPQEVPDRH